MNSRLDVEAWPWQPDLCPADRDFIEWLMENKRQPWMAGTVFHMGPGSHHRVPRTCEALGLECISITVSEDELLMMPQFTSYRCILQNIWDLEPDTLPDIHFMTLFHIGEMAGEYGDVDYEKLKILINAVPVNGRVFFYVRSAAFDRVDPWLQRIAHLDNMLQLVRGYKSILEYKRICVL